MMRGYYQHPDGRIKGADGYIAHHYIDADGEIWDGVVIDYLENDVEIWTSTSGWVKKPPRNYQMGIEGA